MEGHGYWNACFRTDAEQVAKLDREDYVVAIVQKVVMERDRMKAALKPFAELADSYSDTFNDKLQLSCDESNNGDSTYAFTLGDLRRAAEAIREREA
jgi:hypothetical protein